MKTWRWLMGGLLIPALASCGIFFAPLEGRWNPLDPDFGAGYTQEDLYPTVDGYVSSMMGTFQEGTIMKAGSESTYFNLSLMKFNTSDIPEDFPHAELRLYMGTDLSSGLPLQVRLILSDWDPGTITYNLATTEGFLAPKSTLPIPVQYAGWYTWDVTALLQSVTPGSFKGLLVESTMTGTNAAQFWTREQSTNQPHLAIWTR